MVARVYEVKLGSVLPAEKGKVLDGRKVVLAKKDGTKIEVDDKDIKRDAKGKLILNGDRIVDGHEYFRDTAGRVAATVSVESDFDGEKVQNEFQVDLWLSDDSLSAASSVTQIEDAVVAKWKKENPKYAGATKKA